MFYSRRIGLDDDGNPVRILGGARVVGRIGAWDLGLLDMQTASSSTLPSENFGVFRLRRQIINPFSYAGGLFTTRLGEDGSYNIAMGLDVTLRPVGDEFITFRVASTLDDSVASNTNTNNLFKASLFRLQWARRTNKGTLIQIHHKTIWPYL